MGYHLLHNNNTFVPAVAGPVLSRPRYGVACLLHPAARGQYIFAQPNKPQPAIFPIIKTKMIEWPID